METQQQDSSESRESNFGKLTANAIRGILWFCMSFLSAIYIREDSPFSVIATIVTIAGFLIASIYGVKAIWYLTRAIFRPKSTKGN